MRTLKRLGVSHPSYIEDSPCNNVSDHFGGNSNIFFCCSQKSNTVKFYIFMKEPSFVFVTVKQERLNGNGWSQGCRYIPDEQMC